MMDVVVQIINTSLQQNYLSYKDVRGFLSSELSSVVSASGHRWNCLEKCEGISSKPVAPIDIDIF